jgi:hypothetical protein
MPLVSLHFSISTCEEFRAGNPSHVEIVVSAAVVLASVRRKPMWLGLYRAAIQQYAVSPFKSHSTREKFKSKALKIPRT